MNKILFVNACARENSRTLQLAERLMKNLNGEREDINLYEIELSPLDARGITTRENASRTGDFSDGIFNLAKQFAVADTIIVAAPYWDLMFPAVVKIYFEAVTVSGLTFVYGKNGIPKGLCKAKKLIYVTTSGGPIINNFGYEYISVLGKSFYGIDEVKCISAQGLDIYGANVDSILQNAKDSINDLI